MITLPAVDAVTFDFWNTLMWEPAGELLKERTSVCLRVARAFGFEISSKDFQAAHEAAFEGYQRAWYANEQFCVPEAVDVIMAELAMPSGRELREALIQAFSDAGGTSDVRPAENVESCLRELKAAGAKLSIVCDIGLTPSPVVRQYLDGAGLLGYFDHWAFSDEVGAYKPGAAIFRHTLDRLGVEPSRAVHVGDRKRTDVAGAHALGMRAVRYTGVYDDPVTDQPEADLVIDDLADLPRRLGCQ